LGARKVSEMVILTCRTLHFSRAQSSATVVTRPETTSSSQRRPRAMALTRRARRSNLSGRTSLRDALCGSRIWREGISGRSLPGFWSLRAFTHFGGDFWRPVSASKNSVPGCPPLRGVQRRGREGRQPMGIMYVQIKEGRRHRWRRRRRWRRATRPTSAAFT
jgi:hypothetical protein